jgi:hypothetical protein|tara:strand:+ start:24 stop:386 length:363 start_codon:yes stop_codon:yes gene_type:complete
VVNSYYPQSDVFGSAAQNTAKNILESYNIETLNLYWDKKDSLMASATFSFTPSYNMNVNVYLLRFGDVGVGGFLTLSEKGGNAGGISFDFMSIMPGFRFRKKHLINITWSNMTKNLHRTW